MKKLLFLSLLLPGYSRLNVPKKLQFQEAIDTAQVPLTFIETDQRAVSFKYEVLDPSDGSALKDPLLLDPFKMSETRNADGDISFDLPAAKFATFRRF